MGNRGVPETGSQPMICAPAGEGAIAIMKKTETTENETLLEKHLKINDEDISSPKLIST